MTTDTLYEQRSWNPFAGVHLTHTALRAGTKLIPLKELHAVAMADAYQRGQWLGGGGVPRPLDALPAGAGVVPVTRYTGTSRPLKVKRARAFAEALGGLSLGLAGGSALVGAHAARAEQEGVPLWLARRSTVTPVGEVHVAVDRRLVRADVWGAGLPAIRLRGPYDLAADDPHLPTRLEVWFNDQLVTLGAVPKGRKSRRSLTMWSPWGRWDLSRKNRLSSLLSRDGRVVAHLSAPRRGADRARREGFRPLTVVTYLNARDQLDSVVPHFCGVAFGIGDATGRIRFGARRSVRAYNDADWSQPWFTSVAHGQDDCGPSGNDGHDGDAGSDGCGSDGGSGGDGGGGGGDGGGGGGG